MYDSITFMYSKNKKGWGYVVRKNELTDVCPISKNAQKQDECKRTQIVHVLKRLGTKSGKLSRNKVFSMDNDFKKI